MKPHAGRPATRAGDSIDDRVTLHDLKPETADVRAEVLAGLRATPPRIAPKYFYDERGSELFARITQLDVYYPTDAELEILAERLPEITELLGRGAQLVEYGSGNSEKIRTLLEGLHPAMYMPLDISRDHLLESARSLAAEFPWLHVHAVCADYSRDLALPVRLDGAPLAAFFPGSSIGNFERPAAREFLARVHRTLGVGGRLLIGVDRRKPADVIEPAYDDPDGVTAAFNRNVLTHLAHLLGGEVDPDRFAHEAHYDAEAGRIEMHLVAREATGFTLAGERFEFDRGDRIHTENSYKYAPGEFLELAAAADFEALAEWTDAQALFSVFVLRAA